jgi:hypothetical protein
MLVVRRIYALISWILFSWLHEGSLIQLLESTSSVHLLVEWAVFRQVHTQSRCIKRKSDRNCLHVHVATVAISTFSDRQTSSWMCSTPLPEWYESRSRWIAPRKVGWIVLGLWDCQTGLFSAKIWKHYNIYFPIVSDITRLTTDHIYCEVGRWWYPTVTVTGWYCAKHPVHCSHFMIYCVSPSDF